MSWLIIMVFVLKGPNREGIVLTFDGDPKELSHSEEEWMGAYYDGRKIGYLYSKLTSEPPGLLLEQAIYLKLSIGKTSQGIESKMQARLDQKLGLSSFDLDLQGSFGRLQAKGRQLEKELSLEIRFGSQVFQRRVPLEKPLLLVSAVLPKLLARKNLVPHTRYRVWLFDPQSLQPEPTLVEVLGPDAISVEKGLVQATRVRRKLLRGQIDTWIDALGQVVKEEYSFGLVFIKEPADIAKNLPDGHAEKSPNLQTDKLWEFMFDRPALSRDPP